MTPIRHATPEDADTVTTLVRTAFALYVPRLGGVEPWPMRLDYDGIIADGQTWVAEEGGEVVGVVVLEDQADHLLLDVLAVSPGHQGSGIGRRLMAWAEEQAVDRGFDEVRLFTNAVMTENIAYYPRHGYVETHRDEIQGFHRVHFSKVLAG